MSAARRCDVLYFVAPAERSVELILGDWADPCARQRLITAPSIDVMRIFAAAEDKYVFESI